MNRALLVAALSLLVNLPALAADPPTAKAPEAAVAVKAQAAELARLMVPKDDWSLGMEGISKNVQAQLQGHPGSKLTFPPEFGKKVRGEVERVLPYEDLVALHAKELSALYTDKEIEELVAFHKSPLGQKFFKVAPQESEKVAAATQQRFGKAMPELMKTLSAGLPRPDPKKDPAASHQGMPPNHPAMPPAPAKAAEPKPAPAAKPAN